MLWILLQTSFFQNFLIKKVTQRLSKDLHTTVSIRHVDFELFDKMLLQNILVLDHKHDTLLYAGAVKVNINDWFFFKDHIDLKYIGLDNAVINLNRKDSVWNYQFIADYFSGSGKKDTSSGTTQLNLSGIEFNHVKIIQTDAWSGENMTASLKKLNLSAEQFDLNKNVIKINFVDLDEPSFSQYDYNGNRPEDSSHSASQAEAKDPSGLEWNTDGWRIFVKKLNITNGSLAIERQEDTPVYVSGFNDAHIILSQLNGSFANISFVKDTLLAQAKLATTDRSGFVIKNLSADFKFTPKMMEFNHLDIITNKSHLTNYYAMHYNNFNDDMLDFVHKVTLEGRFDNSEVSSDDIAFFAPEVADWKKVFSIKGNAKGTIDNLSAKKMIIKAGSANYLDGDISMRGLPDINETFIDFKANDFRTNYNELEKLIPSLKSITSPDLRALGAIQFKGNYTGFIKDFVTYGTLNTAIGTLKTDLQMKFPEDGKALYSGTISTNNFQLGKFISNSSIGNIAFSGKVKGKGFSASDVDITVDGNISSVTYNGYAYTKIITHGNFKNRLFSGTASINDPNIKIDTLTGAINLSKAHPALNLRADVSRLSLKNLGFTKDSVSLTGFFNLDFTGDNIDNFLGSAKLYNAILLDKDRHLSFDSLDLYSSINNGKKFLSVQTNELALTLNGNFKILELPDAFQLFLYKYYPAYINKPDRKIENQDFSFSIQTKNISDYVSLFDSRISGLNNSVFIGNLNVAENTLNLTADVPHFSYSNISFNTIHFDSKGTQDTLSFNGDIDDVIINNSLHAPGTKIKIVAHNDISDVSIITSANKTLTAADISARMETNTNGFKLSFNPSSFIINDKKWTIAKGGELELNKNIFLANAIKFSQGAQEIYVSTQPSEIGSGNDVIVGISKLNVGDFAPLFEKQVKVNGLMSGDIRINDPFGNLDVQFNTKTDQFHLEDDSIGVLNASGEYVSKSGIIKTHVVSDNALYNFLSDFSYNLNDSSDNQIKGSVVLNNSGIHILEKYLNDIFYHITGRATGTLYLSGSAADTKLTGKVSLDSTALTVLYTQCRYLLAENTVLTFNPDEIDLGTIKIHDTLGGTATVIGKIYHSFFDNFFFNELHVKTDNNGNAQPRFMLLNTTARDNKEFYGTLIGKAELSLNGFVTDMKMSISGEPTDSSHIYLPTGETAETETLDYIDFIKFGREMKTDLSARQSSNIKVDMSITANPYAKIDVILDETTGDVIKAQGYGNLNISAGSIDPLTIRGRYNIQEGEYTFNFQTFLKTPFNLQQGYIEWQGDPYLANLNIDATYRATNVDLSSIPTSRSSTAKGDVDIIFKLRGTLKTPEPSFEFQFPFDNPLKSDPIATEFLKTYQSDQNELNRQVTSLLLFNTFMNNQQGLLTSNNTGNFVTRSVGQLLSATVSASLNSWLQKLLNTHTVNLYTNINTSDFNFQKGIIQKDVQNVGNFGLKTSFLKNRLLVNFGGNIDYRLVQNSINSNSNFLFTPDVSFEYLISPDGRLRVIGFNRSDADIGDLQGLRNRTGVQLSYRKEFNTFTDFFINERKRKVKMITDTTAR